MKNESFFDAENLIRRTYQHFNDRDIEATLAVFHEEVNWPNAMEGGIEHGHEAIRKYWTRQWKVFDPNVKPVSIEKEPDGRVDVTVRQVVKDLQGKLLNDQIIHHVYTFEEGLVISMEIKNAE